MNPMELRAGMRNEINHAASEGDIDTLKRLAKQMTPPMATDEWNDPIHNAICSDHLETLSFLMDECHADLGDRQHILHLLNAAAGHASLPLMHYLLKQAMKASGQDPDQDDATFIRSLDAPERDKLLIEAASNDSRQILSYLAGILNLTSLKDNQELLQEAMLHCKPDIIKYLIEEHKMDVNTTDEEGKSICFHAIETGNVELLKYLIEQQHADLKQTNQLGNNLLHHAIEFAFLEDQKIVRYLIESCHLDVNEPNAEGYTPLDLACDENSNLNLVRYLVETCGAKVRQGELAGLTQLHICAVKRSPSEILEYFIHEMGLDPQAVNQRGDTLLHASFRDFLNRPPELDLVKLLVETYHLDPNARNQEGDTPLILASFTSDQDLILYFLNEGHADLNAANFRGATAFQVICANQDLNFVRTMIQDYHADLKASTKSGMTALFAAAMNLDSRVLQALIEEYGLDPNAKDKSGKTCLFSALNRLDNLTYLICDRHLDCQQVATNGNNLLMEAPAETDDLKVYEFLINQCHLDAKATDRHGANCFHLAAARALPGVLDYLASHTDVDPQATDHRSRNAIFYAAVNHNTDVIPTLVNTFNLEVNAKDEDGNTPLMEVIDDENPDIVQTLIQAGADINLRDENGDTLLMKAVDSGKIAHVQHLIQGGADVSLRDTDGKTALHRAAENFQHLSLDILKLLVEEAGADLQAKDNQGKRPMDLYLPAVAQQYLSRVTAQAEAKVPFHTYQSMFDFLQANEQDAMPDWLRDYQPGDKPDIRLFQRAVYYPGSGHDFQPLKLFSQSHSAHVFIYLDYMKHTYQREDFDHQEGRSIFPGYTVIGTTAYDLQQDLAHGSFQPHMTPKELKKAATNTFERHDPFARLVVCERNKDANNERASERIAVLIIAADAIVSYDMLIANRNMPAPFAVILQDHSLGGNYDKFGKGGLLATIAQRWGILPKYLLVGQTTKVWDGYEPVPETESIIGASQKHLRTLYRLIAK